MKRIKMFVGVTKSMFYSRGLSHFRPQVTFIKYVADRRLRCEYSEV